MYRIGTLKIRHIFKPVAENFFSDTDVEKQSKKMHFRQDYKQVYRNNEEKVLPEISEVETV